MGRPVPLLRPLEITPETHGPRGIGYAKLPDPVRPRSPRYAPQLIVDEARRRPGEITLVTLGPLTNLAVAVLMDPRLPILLKRWVMMGGAFRVPGNTTPTTEWNVHCDPEAARICFAAWQAAVALDLEVARPLVMGLDVTESEDPARGPGGPRGAGGAGRRSGRRLEPGRPIHHGCPPVLLRLPRAL